MKAGLRWIPGVVLGMGLVAAAGQAAYPPQQTKGGSNSGLDDAIPRSSLDKKTPEQERIEAAREKAFANDRQKKLADDSAKLLQMATELKAAVDKTDKNQLSVEVIRRAQEIEKLAKSIRERMKE